jgi:hypothetical protein
LGKIDCQAIDASLEGAKHFFPRDIDRILLAVPGGLVLLEHRDDLLLSRDSAAIFCSLHVGNISNEKKPHK